MKSSWWFQGSSILYAESNRTIPTRNMWQLCKNLLLTSQSWFCHEITQFVNLVFSRVRNKGIVILLTNQNQDRYFFWLMPHFPTSLQSAYKLLSRWPNMFNIAASRTQFGRHNGHKYWKYLQRFPEGGAIVTNISQMSKRASLGKYLPEISRILLTGISLQCVHPALPKNLT